MRTVTFKIIYETYADGSPNNKDIIFKAFLEKIGYIECLEGANFWKYQIS